MNINLANNPIVLPAKNVQSAEILPAGISNRIKSDASQSLTVENQKSIPQPEQSRRLFSLSPRQTKQLSELPNRERAGEATNRSISQYLETESLAKREEIESLVGLDVFA